MTVRVGAVSYLNTKPLIYGLRKRLPDCELRLDLPSRLADQLTERVLDVALIPSIEFLRGEHLSIVSDACIACRGAVRSVRVLFRKPPVEVRSLALDEGSRTSCVLAQVLLERRFGRRPELQTLRIDSSLDSVEADAILVIGDRAMKINSDRYVANWDLGEEWSRETGLPFVFAMWVAADPGVEPRVTEALIWSRDAGMNAIDEISKFEAPRYGLSEADCRVYFMQQLYFRLGPQELAGLDLFRQWAIECGLLPTTSKHLSLVPT